MANTPPEPIQVPVVWVGLEDTPIQLANTFQVQVSAPGEILLNVAQTAPPTLIGTPEERSTQIRALPFVQARTIGRMALTPHRVRELVGILQQALAGHDQTFPR